MWYSIKWWLRLKWRLFKGVCTLCGVDPINWKEVGPFRSETHCRPCMKLIKHSMMYGMSRNRLMQQFKVN